MLDTRPRATRAKRTRLSAGEHELQILRAATKVFARSNYRVAGTADIALEAGIAEPTIYKYFPSKKELFIRILKRVGERILELWHEAAAADSGDSISALKRMGRVYIENLGTHSDELKIQFQALAESDDPDITRQLGENHEAYVQFFAAIIRRGQSQGVVRADADPYSSGWFLNSCGFALTLVQLLGFDKRIGKRQVKRMIEAYLDWLSSIATAKKGNSG